MFTRCPEVIGRAAETALLRSALAEARRGRGSLVTIAAGAGLGKSRLLRELMSAARADEWTAVLGRTSAAAKRGTPFAAITEALLHARRACPDVDPTDLGPWAGALADVLPDGQARITAGGDASAVVRAEAILRMLGALSRTAPLLVGLEDLQWADPDTLGVIEFLAEGLAGYRVLCVTTVRMQPPSTALALLRGLGSAGAAGLVELAPLAADQAREMARMCRPDLTDHELDAVVECADGVPLLVEELLASPGEPKSFADSVSRRLVALPAPHQRVLGCAAVLGRRFDWQLLARGTGCDSSVVIGALEAGVAAQLLDFGANGYFFHHALTRDAVLDNVLPHVRADVARGALGALQDGSGELIESERALAVDLAREAGEPDRAAELLCAAGSDALHRGALGTAVETLRAAGDLARDDQVAREVQAALVDALSQAGRFDECQAAGAQLLTMQAHQSPADQVRTHLALAHAAVEATRWTVARSHLDSAAHAISTGDADVAAQLQLLRAEVALAHGELSSAEALTRAVLGASDTPVEMRCHAFALLGRVHRAGDLGAARAAFTDALACAEKANLPLWRLRCTHELGTIELFEHAGVSSLHIARATAEQLGALSTLAIVDIHLAAAYLFRFDPDAALVHADSALTNATALRADELRATALVFAAEAHSLRRDIGAMERYNSRALAVAPDSASIEGSVWGARGVAALLAGMFTDAERALTRAEELLRPLPHAGPGIYRGLLPLLRLHHDHVATDPIESAIDSRIAVNRANRAMLLLAEAVLASRTGDPASAAAKAASAADQISAFPVWSDLAWLLAVESAPQADWPDASRRLVDAALVFEQHGFEVLARRCRDLLDRPAAHPLARLGVTPRELEILGYVRRGLSNREIAARLTVSPRTVEKHVESLLRKTDTTSRTQLVAVAATS